MILGPNDPRAFDPKRDKVLARGRNMADFNRFLDTDAGRDLVAQVAADLADMEGTS